MGHSSTVNGTQLLEAPCRRPRTRWRAWDRDKLTWPLHNLADAVTSSVLRTCTSSGVLVQNVATLSTTNWTLKASFPIADPPPLTQQHNFPCRASSGQPVICWGGIFTYLYDGDHMK